MRAVALAGGTGSAKLLRGLNRQGVDLTVVANVGDNVWVYGVYVCPDIDVACYSLAGISDRKKGWGIEGDTFAVLRSLRRLGADAWFTLGDRDLATCLARTQSMRSGKTLTEATEAEAEALGLKCRVLPVTDDEVTTYVRTREGEMHLQDFWVRHRGTPAVDGVVYRGAGESRLSEAVRSAIVGADRVVLCPANPVTSIGPMLAVPGFADLLSRAKAPVVALSPMSGKAPFSGPAGKFLKATGSRVDSYGVAKLYARFLDTIVISEGDSGLRQGIESLGVECRLTDTRLAGPSDESRLAKEVLSR